MKVQHSPHGETYCWWSYSGAQPEPESVESYHSDGKHPTSMVPVHKRLDRPIKVISALGFPHGCIIRIPLQPSGGSLGNREVMATLSSLLKNMFDSMQGGLTEQLLWCQTAAPKCVKETSFLSVAIWQILQLLVDHTHQSYNSLSLSARIHPTTCAMARTIMCWMNMSLYNVDWNWNLDVPLRPSFRSHPFPLQAAEWKSKECAWKSNSRNKSSSLLSSLRA